MAFAMVGLKRTKTGRWAARKEIPQDVRAAYGKREEKKTWPAELNQGQAKAELAAWLIPIEEPRSSTTPRYPVGAARLPRRQRRWASGWPSGSAR
jgi:hypothetical protein